MSFVELMARLVLVAGVLAGCMWGLRRYASGRLSAVRATGGLVVVSRASAGRGAQLLLVEADGKRMLVGVGPVQVVAVLEPAEVLAEAVPQPGAVRAPSSVQEPARDATQPPAARPWHADSAWASWHSSWSGPAVARLSAWLGFARRQEVEGEDFALVLERATSDLDAAEAGLPAQPAKSARPRPAAKAREGGHPDESLSSPAPASAAQAEEAAGAGHAALASPGRPRTRQPRAADRPAAAAAPEALPAAATDAPAPAPATGPCRVPAGKPRPSSRMPDASPEVPASHAPAPAAPAASAPSRPRKSRRSAEQAPQPVPVPAVKAVPVATAARSRYLQVLQDDDAAVEAPAVEAAVR